MTEQNGIDRSEKRERIFRLASRITKIAELGLPRDISNIVAKVKTVEGNDYVITVHKPTSGLRTGILHNGYIQYPKQHELTIPFLCSIIQSKLSANEIYLSYLETISEVEISTRVDVSYHYKSE